MVDLGSLLRELKGGSIIEQCPGAPEDRGVSPPCTQPGPHKPAPGKWVGLTFAEHLLQARFGAFCTVSEPFNQHSKEVLHGNNCGSQMELIYLRPRPQSSEATELCSSWSGGFPRSCLVQSGNSFRHSGQTRMGQAC